MKTVGFDHTDFNSEENFKKLLNLLNLNETPSLGTSGGFTYQNNDIKLITLYNPLTGVRYDKNKSTHDLGFSGYIGLEGNSKSVKLAESFILNNTDYKDHNPTEREFI
mgnify:CR=1 FL=1|jgi:hypothetical protein